MAVLEGYFDESGRNAGSKVLAVAGYVSTPERWQAFEQEWKAALAEFGLKAFHMTDFCSLHAKPYNTWTRNERRSRYSRLADIIEEHTLGSVGYAIPLQAFERIFSAGAKRVASGAYGLACTCCFLDTAKLVKARRPDGWIAYVFDSGVKGAGAVASLFQENEQDPAQKEDLRLLSLRFENDSDFVLLQAADILAHELYRHLPRQVGPVSLVQQLPRDNLKELRFGDMVWGYLDETELRKWNHVLSAKAAMTDPAAT